MLKVILFLLASNFLLADILDFKTINQANRAYEQGNFEASVQLFGSLDKEDVSVEYDRANALYKAHKYDEALQAYAKAKGVDEAQRLHNVGNSYFQKKELDKAIEAYEKALKIKEDDDTRFNLELAKKKKKEEEKKKQEQKKKEEKKKENKKKKEQKKHEKKKKDEQKKKDSDKKEDNKKKDEPKKKSDEEKKRPKEEAEKKMTPQEKKQEAMRKRELKHMMKQLQKKKMPTMMYQTSDKQENQNAKGERNAQNPW